MSVRDSIWLSAAFSFIEEEEKKRKEQEDKAKYEFLSGFMKVTSKSILYLHGIQELLYDSVACERTKKYVKKEPFKKEDLPFYRELKEERERELKEMSIHERKVQEIKRIFRQT